MSGAVGNRTYRVGLNAVRVENAPTGSGGKYRITELFSETSYSLRDIRSRDSEGTPLTGAVTRS